MADPYLERERKFDVSSDFQLPEFPDSRHEAHDLRATYYDTDDALLQASGVTLRQRVGGSDDGWHLKAPHPDGKLELHVDLGPADPPPELTALTRGLRFERPLRQQAVLRTTRDAYQLHTAGGDLLAEIADDHVEATIASTHESTRWREIEIELGPAGTTDTHDQLTDQLTAAGATPSEHGSKLAHAVGEPVARPPLSGVGGLVDDYLQTQFERLAWGDLKMRRGENNVHKTRVAVRRIRSTLRIFRRLFDEGRARHLDGELSWYARVLGRVRDLDVIRRTMEADLGDDPDGLITERAAAGLVHVLEAERERAWQQLVTVLDGDRYGALLEELDGWRRQAPMTAAARADRKSVEEFVSRARKKSDKRLERAESAADDKVDDALHRARKSAKRTRYAGELARPEMGKPAKRIVKSHEKRQDALGALQDHVMMVATLADVVGTKPATPDISFLCGVLAQRHSRAKAKARAEWR
ncbi:MAG: CYTH and CHAD domain-containing protein [Nocardioides sp.]|nr:CYTH and CHAD domain-containing protein [Nocardioides sp.]